MGSLNYGVFGPKFSLEGAFRVLRMESFPSGTFYFDEILECGTLIDSHELKALITTAESLQFVDFGNGLLGIYGECEGFHFCATYEHKKSVTTAPVASEKSDRGDIF
jgi:hypothetical protein